MYSISDRDSDNQVLPFTVDANDGAITATKEFLASDKKQYVFTATAYDMPTNNALRQESTTPVYVSVC